MEAISRHHWEVIRVLFGEVFEVQKKLSIGVFDGEWGMVNPLMYGWMPGFVICLVLGSEPIRLLALKT